MASTVVLIGCMGTMLGRMHRYLLRGDTYDGDTPCSLPTPDQEQPEWYYTGLLLLMTTEADHTLTS